jgi:hypothetical protein
MPPSSLARLSSLTSAPGPLSPLQGPELLAKVKATKVLVVGAGGIGCELLKNLVLTGFETLTVRGGGGGWRELADEGGNAA